MAEWIVEAETLGDLADGLWVGGKRFVRCKDCRSSGKEEKQGLVYCYGLRQWVRKDFYCGCSKLRDGEEKTIKKFNLDIVESTTEDGIHWEYRPNKKDILKKINEIIDVVNSIDERKGGGEKNE